MGQAANFCCKNGTKQGKNSLEKGKIGLNIL